MAVSQNGWHATQDANSMTQFKWITGRVNPATVWIFDDFCEWFDKNIETIHKAASWGYNYRVIRAGVNLSNHASGTAIDLNAPSHPLARVGTFTPKQAAAIRARLKRYGGAIRWGGDYAGRKDEMHFEINVSPERLKIIVSGLKSAKPSTSASKPSTSTSKPSTSASKPSTSWVWKGLSKSDTKSVQAALKSMGYYKGVIDGSYGPMTVKAVRAYQMAQKFGNLNADGYWGSTTQAHYSKAKKIQAAMNKWKGTKLVVDGDFASKSANRVVELKKRNHGGAWKYSDVGSSVSTAFLKFLGVG